MDDNKLLKMYDDLPKAKETSSIRQSQLELEKELGSGQFGSVQKGYCTVKRQGRIPVAVKKLKSDDKSAEEEAQEAGKWRLKWFAPECVYYWKFDSKSDVWSYGVTLWEATSLGKIPYRKMKENEILKFLVEDCKRLVKPELCDDQVYHIMLNCWDYEKKERPSFEEIKARIKQQYQRLLSVNK